MPGKVGKTAFKRVLRARLQDVPVAKVPQNSIPDDMDLDQIFSSVVAKLPSLKPHYLDDHPFSRDMMALTGGWRTFHGADRVAGTWNGLVSKQQITDFAFTPGSAHVARFGSAGFILGHSTFKIGSQWPGDGSGTVAIYPDGSGGWKIWFMATFLEYVPGLRDPDSLEKVSQTNGTMNGVHTDGSHGHHSPQLMSLLQEPTFYGDEYPYFLTAKDLARGFQKYVADYALDVRLSTRVESAKWDKAARRWTVQARCNDEEIVVLAKHIVFAVGAIGEFPAQPDIPNRDIYHGTAMHSKQFKNAGAWVEKKGVVVGTANTAHDAAENMLDSDLSSVTMVQRGRTIVIPMTVFKELFSHRYNPDADIPKSDRGKWGLPYPVQGAISQTLFGAWRKREPTLYDGLESPGFKTEIPNLVKIHERAGGQYLDVGASQKIIDGLIQVKGGEIESFRPTGLNVKDGSTLDADLIVFATGFQLNVRHQIARIVGSEIADLLEDNGDLDADGEPRGAWKAQGHAKIWYTSGEFGMARFYSRYLAFASKADLEGKRFQEYRG